MADDVMGRLFGQRETLESAQFKVRLVSPRLSVLGSDGWPRLRMIDRGAI